MTACGEGSRFYRGRSMAGTFKPGDRLTLEPLTMAAARPGDVVIYRSSGGGDIPVDLVHRIVAVTPAGLVVQGDNNPCPDASLVTADTLLGRVIQVERDGSSRPVRGGCAGLLRARLLNSGRHFWKAIRLVGGKPYRVLRASGLIRHCWRPSWTKIALNGEDGPMIKYVSKGRTVACWWPATSHFECRKPFDLILTHPGKSEPSDR